MMPLIFLFSILKPLVSMVDQIPFKGAVLPLLIIGVIAIVVLAILRFLIMVVIAIVIFIILFILLSGIVPIPIHLP